MIRGGPSVKNIGSSFIFERSETVRLKNSLFNEKKLIITEDYIYDY